MKKYKRSELYALLKDCNISDICTELYAEIKDDNLSPMNSGDKFIMTELRNKIKKYKNLKPAQYASIVIIDGNIPCLVFHRDNPGLDSNKDPIIPRSISSIRIPFQGENINQIIFKIYETREILDILADDDYQPKYKSPYANCAKMI